ncbi:hypothetical protein [Sinorhizobium mexicanum]|uniref:hypothetical protein n=1 Tax=Sinorhizobium mexicanum TaxID=375549 RepID=UPI0015DF67AF|nr:hypothetical protein [Sinorhizobium mexicanum]MBP1884918.1 hypothetical protein [Sinorhizobium mexicanum]
MTVDLEEDDPDHQVAGKLEGAGLCERKIVRPTLRAPSEAAAAWLRDPLWVDVPQVRVSAPALHPPSIFLKKSGTLDRAKNTGHGPLAISVHSPSVDAP